jgi:hypothetical protein
MEAYELIFRVVFIRWYRSRQYYYKYKIYHIYKKEIMTTENKYELPTCVEVEVVEPRHIEPSKPPYFWRSCSGCKFMDPRVLMFFSSLCMSMLIIVFCIIKIALSTECNETNTYMALLMFVLGIWLPHPSG